MEQSSDGAKLRWSKAQMEQSSLHTIFTKGFNSSHFEPSVFSGSNNLKIFRQFFKL
jgi:hypothetical protein